jgi:hypothetical protein
LLVAHLYYGRIAAMRRPGFPLQFLSLPAVGLRDFRFNPLRGFLANPIVEITYESASKSCSQLSIEMSLPPQTVRY